MWDFVGPRDSDEELPVVVVGLCEQQARQD